MRDYILTVALVSVRLSPIFVVSPIPPFRRAPLLIRVILSIALAIILCNLVPLTAVSQLHGSLTLLFVSEFVIGISLAFSLHAANAALHSMGQLIDMQIGFAAASLFDPSTEHMASPTAEILTIGMLLVFLSSNIHHELLTGFAKLLTLLPPGSPFSWHTDWLKTLGVMYSIGFIIASPIIIVLWFTDIALAFISRSLPQMPVYFVGLPAKIGIGLLTLSWFFEQALDSIIRLFVSSLNSWNTTLKLPL